MFGDYFMKEHEFFYNPAKSLSDEYVNGTDAHIMESDEIAQKVIAVFKSAIDKGYHPNDVEQDVYRQLNVNPEDIFWYDRERIQKEVSEYWEING